MSLTLRWARISAGALPAHRHLEVGGGGAFDQDDPGLAGDVHAELDRSPARLLGRLLSRPGHLATSEAVGQSRAVGSAALDDAACRADTLPHDAGGQLEGRL